MPLAVKKKQERAISRCGNSAVLYLPTEYFLPGEPVDYELEIDFDGNLKLTVKKSLFNFNCETIKNLVGNGFSVECDETVDGMQTLNVKKGKLSLNCTVSRLELEPTYVSICRLFDKINSTQKYLALTSFVDELNQKSLDAYLETEDYGDVYSAKILQNPQKFGFESQAAAFAALLEKGKKLGFTLTVRFNSKKHTITDVKRALRHISNFKESKNKPP